MGVRGVKGVGGRWIFGGRGEGGLLKGGHNVWINGW